MERRTSRYNGHAQPLALLVRALKVGPISFEIGEVLGRRRTQQKEAKDAAEKPRLRNERRLRDRPSSHFEKNPRGIATVTLAHQPKRFVRKGERCEAEEHQLRSPDGECHAQRRGVERGRP